MINMYSTKSIYYHLGDFYMALRLRRGSDTDRQTETFAEGELIYITDTKELYVGDGTTLGGVLVTSSSGVSPAQLTQNLDLNSFSINGIGIITATAFFGDGSGLTGISGGGGTGIIEGQEYLIDIIGDVRGSDSTLLVDSTTNTFAGDLVGSVFGDNSILLVDAVNNVIPYAVLDGAPTTLAGYGITDAATSAQGNLADSAVQPADLGNFTFTSGTLDTNDSVGITITPAVTINSNLLVENDLRVSNVVYADKFVSTDASTPSIEAATNLDLTAGNAVRITSSVLRLASFTTTERDALAAQNGDVIYNTTDNKFQGYENGAWANLI